MIPLHKFNGSTRFGLRFYKVEIFIGVILLIVAALAMLAGGCQRTLEPGGYYQGDKVLYEAENTLSTGHDLLQTFVTWEAQNRLVLSAYPDIRKAADRVVTQGPSWFASAANMIDAYKLSPTSENKSALIAATDVLRAAIREASNYMASNRITGPPPASTPIR